MTFYAKLDYAPTIFYNWLFSNFVLLESPLSPASTGGGHFSVRLSVSPIFIQEFSAAYRILSLIFILPNNNLVR